MSEKKRILFVDDDRNLLNGLRRMLHEMRHEWKMEFVTRSQDALKVMADTSYDIIISNIRLPGKDGEDLLEKVKLSMEAGVTGLIFGRNMWQRDLDEALRLTEKIKRMMSEYPA